MLRIWDHRYLTLILYLSAFPGMVKGMYIILRDMTGALIRISLLFHSFIIYMHV